VDHLSAMPMMAEHLIRGLPSNGLAVASPDIGGIKRAQLFRELLERRAGREVELVFVEKRREGDVISGGTIIGDVSGRAVGLLDDLCASGATLIKAAKALRAAGATSVYATVTHTPMEAGVQALAASDHISQVIVTDSVGYSLSPGTVGNQGK